VFTLRCQAQRRVRDKSDNGEESQLREQIKSKAVDLLPQTPPRPLLRDQRLQLVTTMKAVC
jgi:hypothetical protein